MKKIIALVLFVLIILAMVVTCPDKDAHMDAVKTELNKTMESAIAEETGENSGLASLGSTLMSGVLSPVVDNMLEVDNYFVCSVGKVEYEGKSTVLSIGVFGHVFTTFNSDTLKDIAEKKFNEKVDDLKNIFE